MKTVCCGIFALTIGLSAQNISKFVISDEAAKKTWPTVVILHGSNMNGHDYASTIASAWPEIAREFIRRKIRVVARHRENTCVKSTFKASVSP